MIESRKETIAVVLAAGRGTRMRSDVPKALHQVGGRALVAHVLASLESMELSARVVVASERVEDVERAVDAAGVNDAVTYVVQHPAQGTGDAVRIALENMGGHNGHVLVMQAATPLVTTATLEHLLSIHEDREAAATLLSAHVADPAGYGRIVRDSHGELERVVEERDATDAQKAIDEVNAGVYAFDAGLLSPVLDKLDRENAQNEYYLTDVIGLLRSQGRRVVAHPTHPKEVLGIKSRAHLARMEQVLRRRTCERWMNDGVTIIDPATTYIDASVSIGRDAVIRPFTFLEGHSVIGTRADIGPQARIVDSEIGPDAAVSFAVVVGSSIGPQASVGPFASVRAGTALGKGARVGTFVETKQTTIGEGSKANHLAYLGDADVGKDVNVGAGTITCNWDGRAKHRSVIDDDAYIGSDTMLVAPVRIGKRAATGAGAVVKGEVPDDALAVGVPARILEGKGDKMGRGEASTDEDPHRDPAAGGE